MTHAIEFERLTDRQINAIRRQVRPLFAKLPAALPVMDPATLAALAMGRFDARGR